LTGYIALDGEFLDNSAKKLRLRKGAKLILVLALKRKATAARIKGGKQLKKKREKGGKDGLSSSGDEKGEG